MSFSVKQIIDCGGNLEWINKDSDDEDIIISSDSDNDDDQFDENMSVDNPINREEYQHLLRAARQLANEQEGHSTEDNDTNQMEYYLVSGIELLSHSARYASVIDETKAAKSLQHIKNLSLWLRSHKYLGKSELRDQRSSPFFYNSTWKFEEIIQNNPQALNNPISSDPAPNFAGDPRLKFDIDAMVYQT